MAYPQRLCDVFSPALRRGAAGAFLCVGVARALEGLTAAVQVAHMPFERNWAHLGAAPALLFLEVGANAYDLERNHLAVLLRDNAGGFVISFEPLLDKYAGLLVKHGGMADAAAKLGLHHRRGLALPFAVGCPGNAPSAVLNVAKMDGCSSIRAPTEREGFASRNGEEGGVSWSGWVETLCLNMNEQRTVPCVSLETVISDWLHGRAIARLKIDAQGSDLEVVRSAGSMSDRVHFVTMEVVHDSAVALYEGQQKCSAVMREMRGLGFVLADQRREQTVCQEGKAEMDVEFIQHGIAPLWASWYESYPVCSVTAAAGACGGPYCYATELGLHINRTGGCAGRLKDELWLEPNATHMLMLWVAPGCGPAVRISWGTGTAGFVVSSFGMPLISVDGGKLNASARRQAFSCTTKLENVQATRYGNKVVHLTVGANRPDLVAGLMMPHALIPISMVVPGFKKAEIVPYELNSFLGVLDQLTVQPAIVWPARCGEPAGSYVWKQLLAAGHVAGVLGPSGVGGSLANSTFGALCVLWR